MCGGPQNVTTTTKTEIDPTTKARQDALWNAAGNTAGTWTPGEDPYASVRSRAQQMVERGGPYAKIGQQMLSQLPAAGPGTFTPSEYEAYTGPGIAGLTPDQLASYEMARSAATTGQPEVNQAMGAFQGLLDYAAPEVTPGQATAYDAVGGVSSFEDAASKIGSASARDVASKNFTDYDIQQYMNPFIGEVVDRSLSDLERARQIATLQNQSKAAAAGAYGGSRHGVVDVGTNREFADSAGNLASQLRMAGFDKAAGLITGDADRDLAAQRSNQSADVATSTANVGARTNALGLFNDISKFNAGNRTDVSKFNTNLDFAGQTANQGADLASAGVKNAAAGNLAATAGQAQGMAAKGSDLLNRIGMQQQAQKQNENNFTYQQWQEAQNDPYKKLAFMQGFTGTPGQTSTSTTPVYTNPFGQVLGAAGTVLPFLL